jgi:hypothetical protein
MTETVFTPVGRKQEATPEPAPAAPVAQPTFPYRAYGLALTPLGDEGTIIAEGHVPARRFIAACNHLACKEMGLGSLIEGMEFESLEDVYGEITYCWVLPVENPYPDWEWYVRYDSQVTAETPGAIAVTMWGPW